MPAVALSNGSAFAPTPRDPRALLLTSDPTLAGSVCRSLQPPYVVTAATDTSHAMDLALSVQPDVIMADATLPGLYPQGLLAALRRRRELADVPVIALIAPAQAQGRARLLREGARECIAMPLSPEELCIRVDALASQRWATLALQHDKAACHSLFEQASDGIFVADSTGCFVDVNLAGCEILHRPRGQIVGSSFAEMLPTAQRGRLGEGAGPNESTGTHAQEWTLMRGDGTRVEVEISNRLLSDGRWLAIVRDVSERRQRLQAAEDQAQQLEQRVQERTVLLRQLAAELEVAESRERSQIARDLHDDLGQTLAAASIRLAPLQEHAEPEVRKLAASVAGLIDDAQRATRSLAAQLSPPVLYRLGLVPALEWLADELRGSFGLAVEVEDDGGPKPLSQEARSIVYRAVRELLINVAKHAKVDHAHVQVSSLDGAMTVRVSDAGVGFDHDAAPPPRRGRGLGLRSVQERLSYIGGRFELRAVPGDGTEVILTVPLAPPPPQRGPGP